MHSLSYNFVCLSKICYSILVSPHKDEMNLHRVKVNYMIQHKIEHSRVSLLGLEEVVVVELRCVRYF